MLKYLLKRNILNRQGMAYSIIFPIAYVAVYLFAMSGLVGRAQDSFEPIPVAVFIQGEKDQVQIAQEALKMVGGPGRLEDGRVLADDPDNEGYITFVKVSQEEADRLMDEGEVKGQVHIDNSDYEMDIRVKMAQEGLSSTSKTILYSSLDTMKSIFSSTTLAMWDEVEKISQALPEEEVQPAIDIMVDEVLGADFTDYTPPQVQASEKVNSQEVYVYASMAYICLFFMSTGVEITLSSSAPHRTTALREEASPLARPRRVLLSLASWVILIGLVLALVIAIYYLNGTIRPETLADTALIMGVGTLVGLLMGAALAAIPGIKEGPLTGITIALPLILATGSGMMVADLKYLAMEKFPRFSRYNPMALINNGIYYLNYYPTKDLFYKSVLVLAVLALILLAITLVLTRRSQYENI